MTKTFNTYCIEEPILPDEHDANSDIHEQIQSGLADDTFVTGVSASRLFGYIPEKSHNSGVAVVICPGGGYYGLSMQREGHTVAKQLASEGINAFVLKYRLPNVVNHLQPHLAPLEDLAMGLLKLDAIAQQFDVKLEQTGVMGFSAGGHLAATYVSQTKALSVLFKRKKLIKPDFQALIYPVISMVAAHRHQGSVDKLLLNDSDEKWRVFMSPELHVKPHHPRTFLLHANDDKSVDVANSLAYQSALNAQRVPCQAFYLAKGGHAFATYHPVNWLTMFTDWLS